MKRFLIITGCLFALLSVEGQDTTYLDAKWKEVPTFMEATYFQIVEYDPVVSLKATETTYFKSGQIRQRLAFSNYEDRIMDGKQTIWYESGQLRRDMNYDAGKLSEQLRTYWENGNPKRIDLYRAGELIEGKCMTSAGKDTVYYVYEKMPEFPGGQDELIQYISSELRYPPKARRHGVEGRVVVIFTIGRTGEIYDIGIIQGVSKELDAEAKRVIEGMPRWEPGMQDGEAVRVSFTLPMHFRLN